MSFTPTYHQRNLANLNALSPNTRAKALQWYQWCVANKVDILIYETTRTLAQQKENIRKGASKTLKSYHLVGQALDFVPIKNGAAQWSKTAYSKRPILTAIEYAEKLGFESGYRWGWDAPHLQFNYRGYGTDKVLTVSAASVAPVVTPKTYLETGDTGEKVKALQEKLNMLGIDTNGIDGVYGKGTANAVMILQRRTSLEPDGICGVKTLAKIDELVKDLLPAKEATGEYRIYTGLFKTKESAEASAKEIGYNAFEKELRVWTGTFTTLSSAEKAHAEILADHGLNPMIRKVK